jgi:hypothetical protein
MGGSRPKVKQTNFTPPEVKPTGPSAADLAFQATVQDQLKIQQQAYQQQLAGMSEQFRTQQENSSSLLSTLNQQLEATKAKADADAELLKQANATSAEQTQLMDAQRGATQAKALDDMSNKRGALSLLRRQVPTRRKRSLLKPNRGF